MADPYALIAAAVVVEEHVSFTLSALCQASDANLEQVHALVGEGLLHPTGPGPTDWQFDGDALSQTRKALRLAHDFELDMAAVALVMDLLGEIDRLRSRLPRH